MAATHIADEAAALLPDRPDAATVEERILAPLYRRTAPWWWRAFAVAVLGAGLLFALIGYTLWQGLGTWGIMIPVAWGFAIINFVWWVGIGHAGTLISAILLLLEQKWRTSINRAAEAMTLFAVVQAGLFPLLHMGRPWLFYWLMPYPSTMGIWPQFRSPLTWDVVAISTYLTVSFLFWYLGLVPDLASMRDGAPTRLRRILYGIFALGWRGSARHWQHYRAAYMVLAGIATPLVLSVHTVVSFDFAVTQLPGWHSTVFPPYFVAGAIFSGFAMVLTILIPVRRLLGLEGFITLKHLENMGKVILATGSMVGYSYLIEFFLAWYSGSTAEFYTILVGRPTGWHKEVFWLLMFCNLVVPQFLWSTRLRRSIPVLFVVSILVNVGMWCERFLIIVTSLETHHVPAIWRPYSPTWVDWGILLGTLGFFATLFLLFLRFVPAVAISEIKELAREARHGGAHR